MGFGLFWEQHRCVCIISVQGPYSSFERLTEGLWGGLCQDLEGVLLFLTPESSQTILITRSAMIMDYSVHNTLCITVYKWSPFTNLVGPPSAWARLYEWELLFIASLLILWYVRLQTHFIFWPVAAHIRKRRFHAEVRKCVPVTHRRISTTVGVSTSPWCQCCHGDGRGRGGA